VATTAASRFCIPDSRSICRRTPPFDVALEVDAQMLAVGREHDAIHQAPHLFDELGSIDAASPVPAICAGHLCEEPA